MQYTLLLNKNDSFDEIIAQEQTRFVRSVLEGFDVPVEWESETLQTIEQKAKFRKILDEYNIHVLDDMDGGLKIYIQNDMVAEWYKTSYRLKEDSSQIDPKKQIYVEANIKFWTIFENTNDES